MVFSSKPRDNFPAFVAWALANGYESSLTIDRADSDRDCEPANCRWLTRRANG
ncbi:hypothetical protein ACWGH8_37905 [Nonomuraea muscovyensis]|uniref:Uncharacterized protein n=1 Tax=Nonomuraea muscovyensis TaxID=1124761 RepID=A0A7X0F024_9ACTN|nr:hypothetical protein [Nonomuraea muscovyensis]MBB6347271.1 hypothetical protein [Nonomuraea muscovyensis]